LSRLFRFYSVRRAPTEEKSHPCSHDTALTAVQGGQQLVQGDWEIPHAHSGRVEYRISDGGPRAADAQLTEPFDAKHIGLVVESVEYHGIYHWNIRVDRYQVPGQIAVDECAGAQISNSPCEAIFRFRWWLGCHFGPLIDRRQSGRLYLLVRQPDAFFSSL
jgi:hypothetical protein